MRTQYAVSGGDAEILMFPRGAVAAGTRRGVIVCHGAGGFAAQGLDPALDYLALNRKLVDHGQMVLNFSNLGGGNLWGNDTLLAAMTAAWNRLTSTSGGATKTDKVVVVGGSEGGCNAVNWAYRNPTLVACLVLIIPVLDLQDCYEQNRGGLAAGIAAAYGGSAPNYATRSPLNLASGLAGIPAKVWYATDDPITPTAAVNTTFAASVGPSATARSMGTVGHSYAAADVNEVLAFVAANAP